MSGLFCRNIFSHKAAKKTKKTLCGLRVFVGHFTFNLTLQRPSFSIPTSKLQPLPLIKFQQFHFKYIIILRI